MEDDLTRAVRVHYFDRTPDQNNPYQAEPSRQKRISARNNKESER